MMGSQVMAGTGMPGGSDPNSLGSAPSHLHRLSGSPSSASSSPAQVPYEARISLNPLQYPGGVQYPQAPYTANLNFNLINNVFKPTVKEIEREVVPSSSPPSSDSGSPRTDSAGEQTEMSSEGPEQLSGLEIMRQQIQKIPEQIEQQQQQGSQQLPEENQHNVQMPEGLQNGASAHEDDEEVETVHNGENVIHEIHDVEDEDEEEMHIDEEMADEGNASLENPIDGTFEEEKEGEDKTFVGFQPYLQPRTGLTNEGASSLEKLQQVLNNRMFDTGGDSNGKRLEEEIGEQQGGDSADKTYGFQLPEDEPGQIYNCHLCTFSADTRLTFSNHVNTHYTFQCVKCEFETKNEVEYCKHLRHEHSLSPEDLEEAEVRAPRVNSQGKVKSFKCKQCEFVAVTKIEFWKHGRGHIKPEKLLFCPKCIFVTEYKHHLEYHLRNHYGTKPFKCTHCNYSCVNKSMLNSHMKSHNNVYQYRCADCTYATKYCHSLKLHLKKYTHKPAMVLNQDGSPNPLPMDMFGNRQGGGGKKGKGSKNQDQDHLFPPSLLPQFGGGFPGGFPPGLMQMMQMQQQLNGPKLPIHPYKPEGGMEEERGVSPPSMLPVMLRCDKCDFTTSSSEVHKNHMLLHATSERSALHQLLSSPLTPKPARSSEPREGFPLNAQKLSSPNRQLHQRPVPPFLDRPESPPSNGNAKPPQNLFLQNPFMPNPFLANLMPNPAIQALMEERKKQDREAQAPSSLDLTQQQSPKQTDKEEAPLPPNKRLKPDIFASLYASRLSELEKKSSNSPGSPPLSGVSVLDLSKESPEAGPIGGGSHGSSSDNDSNSNPRSHSSSPSLTSSTTKNRRKGKAFKIVQQEDTNSEDEGTLNVSMPSLMPIRPPSPMTEKLMCKFCGISFQNQTMHTIHMGYHGYTDPFKCNHCGDESQDALSFFLHIARKEHS